MSQKKRIPPSELRLLGRRPRPYSSPTKAELEYWNKLFTKAFPDQTPDACLMDHDYIAAYITWLETAKPKNALLVEVYQTWLNYLGRKKERERIFYAVWRKTLDEGFARKEPLHELHKIADLEARRAQREFDFPDEPKNGIDPSLDALRERYEYYSYSRAEVREAVEKELRQLKNNLAELRIIGGEKFNREILPALSRAIDNFLEAKPNLGGSILGGSAKPDKEIKESTRLLSLIEFAEHVRNILGAFAHLQKTMSSESAYVEELGQRLTQLTRGSSERDWHNTTEEDRTEQWRKDYKTFEKSKGHAFDIVRFAWRRLAVYADVELSFHPAYTDPETFLDIIYYQQKITSDNKIVAFCWAWLTFLKSSDLEAARSTFGKIYRQLS